MRTVASSWNEIEAVLRENANSVFRSLRKPASATDVNRLARTFGRKLPTDLLRSLANHDGLRDSYHGQVRLFNNWSLLPIKLMLDARKVCCEVQAMLGPEGVLPPGKSRAVKTDLRWRDGWLPFMDADGDMLFIDLDPGPDGRVGQVVKFYNSDRPRPVIAPSFRSWLSALADRLVAREFKLDEYGGIWFDDMALG
ncbi:SMI1/KNR4 family protein [Anatilimnocola sp. NA78]|uniref:SMI1/KNR4 family protein n=1 Tax=Anatilimnocola sp. NA78 TaxID=3415683 RepID=UPI003CE50C21